MTDEVNNGADEAGTIEGVFYADDYMRGKYDVLCGYEVLPELWLQGRETLYPVARCIDFNSAAHLMRTLEEHGEGDMTYIMMPSGIYECVVTK